MLQVKELKGQLAEQKENLKAKEQENANIKQELETVKPKAMAFEKQLQAKAEQDRALKQKFEVEILPLLTAPNWENWQALEEGIFALNSRPDWPEDVEQHIVPLFNDPAWEVQRTAILLLGPRFSPSQLKQQIIPLLDRKNLLGNEQWRIRQAAVTVLGQRFSSVQVEQPLLTLLKDPAWQVRKEVIEALSPRLSPEQLEQHITPLLEDVAWQVRQEVVTVLSQRASPAFAEQKIIPLSKDAAWEVRATVARRLGTLIPFLGTFSKRPEAREALIALKEKDSSEQVRQAADYVTDHL